MGVGMYPYGKGPAVLLSPEVTIPSSPVTCIQFESKLLLGPKKNMDYIGNILSGKPIFANLSLYIVKGKSRETELGTWSFITYNNWSSKRLPLPSGTYRVQFNFQPVLSSTKLMDLQWQQLFATFWLANVLLSDGNCTQSGKCFVFLLTSRAQSFSWQKKTLFSAHTTDSVQARNKLKFKYI